MRTHAPAWGVLVAAFSVVLVVGLGAFGVGRIVDAWVGELPSVHDPNAFAYSAKTRIYANDRTTLLAEFYLQDQEPIATRSYQARQTISRFGAKFAKPSSPSRWSRRIPKTTSCLCT